MDFSPVFQCYTLGGRKIAGFEGVCFFSENFDEVQIDTDGDFECKRLTCFFDQNGGPQTEATRRIPTGVLFNIRDNSTGRLLFNGFADTGEIFGDGRIPFVLPTSHFFKRGGQAQMIYAPNSQQGPDFGNGLMWLVMVGAKHFDKR